MDRRKNLIVRVVIKDKTTSGKSEGAFSGQPWAMSDEL
jgi:hypothetical protein